MGEGRTLGNSRPINAWSESYVCERAGVLKENIPQGGVRQLRFDEEQVVAMKINLALSRIRNLDNSSS